MTLACLSLGSNVAPEANLRSAIAALRARFGELKLSQVYRCEAVGFEGPDFLNAAAVVDTDIGPVALDAWLHELEDAHGRDRDAPRFGDRTLDIDLVLYGDLVLPGPGTPGAASRGSGPGQPLQLPRDELHHAFVLRPLAEIAPDMVEPRSGRTLAQLWLESPERDNPMTVVRGLDAG
jgi:2-amino-4-hydroxy-6-hydroxymethyldihydropteridine diphosphokinase